MILPLLQLLMALLVIVAAAECFTNALENLGDRLGISEGVTGSLFAAVGTALPETVVPLLALAAGSGNSAVNQDVATGAILGAPLMLATLTIFLMASAAVPRRGLAARLRPEPGGLVRDLHFFLAAFTLAALGLALPEESSGVRLALALLLVGLYAVYVTLTVRASAGLVAQGHGTDAWSAPWLVRLGLPDHGAVVALQLVLGTLLLLGGAQAFIDSVEQVSHRFGFPALLLSLIVIPVATELPEKVNSVLWIRRGKDTLAFANITGAMVFQGTLLPAIGIVLTPWRARPEVLAGMAVTLFAALWLRVLCRRNGVPLAGLLLNGLLYAAYLAAALLLI